MGEDPDRWLSQEQAARIWKRAAELQSESAQRLEERSRSLAPDDASQGYRLEHVREAAVGAGIAPEFVDLALADVGGSDAGDDPTVDRLSRRFLGEGPEALMISRVMEAPAERVFEVLQRVLPVSPYALVLVDTRGPHPLEGGVLVFDVPKFTATGNNEPLAYEMAWGDVKELHLRLQRLGTDPPRCEVAVRAPLGYSRRLNLALGGGLTGVLWVGTSAFGASLGASVASAMLLGPAGVAAAIVAGALAAGGGGSAASVWGWRTLYRYAVRRSETALRKLLQHVNAQVQLGSFGAPAPTPALPREAWPNQSSPPARPPSTAIDWPVT